MLTKQLLDQINHVLRPIRMAIANQIARAVVTLTDDGQTLQSLQLGVLADETVDDCERFQEYGFTSNPIAGAEGVVLFLGGDRSRGLVVAVDDRRYRVANLEAGEVAVYNNTGAKIVMKKNGDIEVTPAAGKQILAGGSQPLAFANHTHLDGNGLITSTPASSYVTATSPPYNPMLPVSPANKQYQVSGSDGGTTILKGA